MSPTRFSFLSLARIFRLGASGAAFLLCGIRFCAADFYVNPVKGSDSNPGSAAAPFQTIERARQAVRSVNGSMSANINVWLAGGNYWLDSTLAFDSADSGTNGFRVIYRAMPLQTPALSGGTKITGWQLYDASKNIWRANAGGEFRQLYVNGHRAIRARTPNLTNANTGGPYYRMLQWQNPAITVRAYEVSSLPNPEGVELVCNPDWSQFRLRVESINVANDVATVTIKSPDRDRSFTRAFPYKRDGDPYYFENAYSLLDAPGEWYLDSNAGSVFYKPRAGESMTTAVVVAPRLENVVTFTGEPGNPIHDIQLTRLAIQHSNWTAPNYEGFTDIQATLYTDPSTRLSGGVEIHYANRIQLDRCIVRHMGAQGILLDDVTEANRIVGCAIADISGSGIVLRGDGSTSDTIMHNYVTACGRDYRGAVGIAAQYVANCTISHNELFNLPYSGISVGWGWTDADTHLRDNQITFNHVHHVMQLLHDGGGIYTLSKQPGTLLFANFIHHIASSPWGEEGQFAPVVGTYHDEGSSFMTHKRCVYQFCPGGTIFSNSAHDITFTNNVASDPFVQANAGPQSIYKMMRAAAEP